MDAPSISLEVMYHVPRSQVWEGSRGRQSGHLHLHVDGRAACGKRGWYERPADADDVARHERCPQCVTRAERLEIEWPS